MRGVILFLLSTSVHACWFYSKDEAVNTITEFIKADGHDSIDRAYLDEKMNLLPGPLSWVVKFGSNIFEDCDEDGDGRIFMSEARSMSTCLDSCTKLAAVNMVVRI